MRYLLTFLVYLTSLLNSLAQTDVTSRELEKHINYLTSNKTKGRYPGTRESERVIKYIRNNFRRSGLKPVNGIYLQPFEAKLRVKGDARESGLIVPAFNVVGFIEGSDPVLSKEYVVLGAHYDHLGFGGAGSKKLDTVAIHHGADDNASGTSAMLEIAEKLGKNSALIKRSVIFIAFGAEEQGLLGSKYFTENPLIPLSQVKVMINMDMVGRMDSEKHLYINGVGTFDGGMDLMKNLSKNFDVNPILHNGGVGGSDHVSFFKKNISVMGVHTGGHAQYHTPEDTKELINLPGEKVICDLIYNAILAIANKEKNQFC